MGQKRGSGEELERRVQHEGVSIADGLVTRNADDRRRGLHQPLVVEPREIAAVVLVDDLSQRQVV
jgi:hypothetical protein